MKLLCSLLSLLFFAQGQLQAEELNTVEFATRLGMARIKQAASDWQKNKSCFSCHHQTLPMLAAIEADRVGIPLDKEWLKSQADTTLAYFEERVDEMDNGKHVPGGAATTGFGFWALSLDQRLQDDTTASMVRYLLQIQGAAKLRDPMVVDSDKSTPSMKNDGHWQASCRRAPMQASMVGDTVLVLLGIEKYATAEQRLQVNAARNLAEQWLIQTPLRHHQDRLWRLWGLHHLDSDDALKQRTLKVIIEDQREDGGWAETKNRESDPYSTGQALFMLLKSGSVAADSPTITKARDYLLKRQYPDGSWLAESHVEFKAQTYFENGDPFGEHQFISTAATAWATAGLAQLLPPKPERSGP